MRDTELFTNAVPHRGVKVLVAADNSAHFFISEGYGTSFGIKYVKYNSARTVVLQAAVTIATATAEDFDVVQDSAGYLYVAYIFLNDIKVVKLNSSGTVQGAPYIASTSANPNTEPKLSIDYKDQIYIVFRTLMGPSNNQHFITTRNTSSAVITAPIRIQNNLSNYGEAALCLTDDLLVYIAYTNLSTNQVYYEVRDEAGAVIAAPVMVSGATDGGGYGTLNGIASKPKIGVTDNKTLFVTFLQDKGTGKKGVSIYTGGGATLTDLINSLEDFKNYDVVFDSYMNELHLALSRIGNTDYLKWEAGSVIMTTALYADTATYISIAKDRFGSLLYMRTAAFATTYTNYGTTQPIAYIGAAIVVGGFSTVSIAGDELLISSAVPTFKVGDRLTISGSSFGNNGAKVISAISNASINASNDHYLVKMVTSFTAPENPAVGVLGQFASPDGNEVRFIKSTSELSQDRAYRMSVLSTDVLLSRIHDQTVLNYILDDILNTDRYGIYGGAVVDWSNTLVSNFTIVGSLSFYDLVNNLTYTIAAGSYPMNNNQALYVNVDSVNLSTTPTVVNLIDLPMGETIAVLGFVANGDFNPLFLAKGGVTRLSPGEQDTVGQDLALTQRQRLGILTETTYEAYTSTNIIAAIDSHPAAISKLDLTLWGIITNNPEEEYAIVGPTPVYYFDATGMSWDPDNTALDIAVFINGVKQTQSITGGLDQAYRKNNATELQFSFAVPENARITVRLERTGGDVGTGGPLTVQDENFTIDSFVNQINFVGSGVTATQTAPGTVQVLIPGMIGSVENIVKLVKNGQAYTLPAKKVTAWQDDGTIDLANASTLSLSDFAGITITSIAPGAFGYVIKNGNCPGALAGFGAAPGQEIYLDTVAGQFTLTAPTGLTDSVIKIGKAEPPSGVATSLAEDLFIELEVINSP
jgi:hypothetical protein